MNCPHTFKSRECGYTGTHTTCDGSIQDCMRHLNLSRWGGWNESVSKRAKPAKRYLWHTGGCGGKAWEMTHGGFGFPLACASCGGTVVYHSAYVMTEEEHDTWLLAQRRSDKKFGHITNISMKEVKTDGSLGPELITDPPTDYEKLLSDKVWMITKGEKSMRLKNCVRSIMIIALVKCVVDICILAHPGVMWIAGLMGWAENTRPMVVAVLTWMLVACGVAAVSGLCVLLAKGVYAFWGAVFE